MRYAAAFFGVLAIITAATLAFGADAPSAALFFSALLAGLCAIICVTYRGPVGGFALTGLLGAAGLYIIGLFNGWASSGADDYSALAAAFGVFAAAQIAGRDNDAAQTLWRATILVGGLIAGAAFIDFIIDPSTNFGLVESSGRQRLSFPFLSANNSATFCGVIALLSVAELIRVLRRFEPNRRGALEQISRSAVFPTATLLLSLTCVFLTGSRAGATLLAGSILVLIMWEMFRGVSGRRELSLKSSVAGLAVVAMLGLIFIVSGDLYADRMEQTRGLDATRQTAFQAYIEAFPIAPLFGHGLGGFPYISALIADAETARPVMLQGAAHNVVLQWLLQGGVVGVGFIGLTAFSWTLLMRRGLMRRNRLTGYMRASILTGVFVTAHGMVDFALEIQGFVFLFAWVCGLGAGVATGGSRILAPGGGRQVSRAISVLACAILVTTSALSFWAFTDRSDARVILAMDDAQFSQTFDAEQDLSGSAVRLAVIGTRALDLEAPDFDLAARALARSLEKEPRDGMAEARYAIALTGQAGFVTPQAVAAFSRSYTLMPYGTRQFAAWRLDAMEALWAYLPPRVHEAAIREARVYGPAARLDRLVAPSPAGAAP